MLSNITNNNYLIIFSLTLLPQLLIHFKEKTHTKKWPGTTLRHYTSVTQLLGAIVVCLDTVFLLCEGISLLVSDLRQ